MDPEQVVNNQEIEEKWAERAFMHAETYMKLLKAISPSKLKLTPVDQELYEAFRSSFPKLNVKDIDIEEFKSDAAKTKWREFLEPWADRVQESNWATLLRLKSDEDYGPENSFIATRVQFYAVEITRNKEGDNDKIHNEK